MNATAAQLRAQSVEPSLAEAGAAPAAQPAMVRAANPLLASMGVRVMALSILTIGSIALGLADYWNEAAQSLGLEGHVLMVVIGVACWLVATRMASNVVRAVKDPGEYREPIGWRELALTVGAIAVAATGMVFARAGLKDDGIMWTEPYLAWMALAVAGMAVAVCIGRLGGAIQLSWPVVAERMAAFGAARRDAAIAVDEEFRRQHGLHRPVSELDLERWSSFGFRHSRTYTGRIDLRRSIAYSASQPPRAVQLVGGPYHGCTAVVSSGQMSAPYDEHYEYVPARNIDDGDCLEMLYDDEAAAWMLTGKVVPGSAVDDRWYWFKERDGAVPRRYVEDRP